MKAKKLGHITGKLLVFGGVYSNLQALEALCQVAQEKAIPPMNIVCTGDIIGYCAQPEECVQFIKKWGIHVIAGNVELNIREEADDCGCNFNEGSRCDLFSKQWYPYALSKISKDTKDFLETLPEFLTFQIGTKKAFVVHGSYFNTSEFIFKSTPWVVKEKNFQATQSDIIIAGHCGLPFVDENSDKTWFNPGVIGMPANDGTPRVWYGFMEQIEEETSFHISSLAYNYKMANSLMLEATLPRSYAQTLLSGIWDNCEALPPKEANLQGRLLLDYQK